MKILESLRSDYSSQKKIIAKNFAIILGGGEFLPTTYTNLAERLEAVFRLELKGKIREAAELLGFRWGGFGCKIDDSELTAEESADLRLRVGSVLSTLSVVDQIVGGQEQAKDILSTAKFDFEVLGFFDKSAMAGSKLGFIYCRTGDFLNAEAILESALAKAESAETKFHILGNIGINERKRGNYEKAEKLLLEVAGAKNISGYIIANAKNSLGIIYKDLGETSKNTDISERYFEQSIKCFVESLEYYDLNNKTLASGTWNNLGRLYETLGDYRGAIFYLRQSKTYFYQEKNEARIADVCHSLATLYLKTGETSKAIANIINALDRISEKDSAQKSECALVYAIALSRNSQDALAMNWFGEAVRIANYLSDTKLRAKAELFHLRELFDTFNKADRLRIYQNAASLLSGAQDKEVIETLKEIEQKLELPDRVAAIEKATPAGFYDLNAEILKIRKSAISQKLDETGGNILKTAEMLNLNRVNLKNEIERDHPELLTKLNQPGRPAFIPVRRHRLISKEDYQKLAKILLQYPVFDFVPDTYLFYTPKIWEAGDLICYEGGERVEVCHIIRESSDYYLKFDDDESIQIPENEMDYILGKIVAYCSADDLTDYSKGIKKGIEADLPLIEI